MVQIICKCNVYDLTARCKTLEVGGHSVSNAGGPTPKLLDKIDGCTSKRPKTLWTSGHQLENVIDHVCSEEK